MLRTIRNTQRTIFKRSLLNHIYSRGAIGVCRRHSSVSGSDTFLSTTNAVYIDEMYAAWQKDPSSVHVSWDAYFKNMGNLNIDPASAFISPHSLVPTPTGPGVPQGMIIGASAMGSNVDQSVLVHLKVQLLCRAYQVRGHQKAHIDPLQISFGDDASTPLPRELTLEHYGFTEKDLDQDITLGPGILPRFANDSRKAMKLREIVDTLENLYCSSYGVEYIHIPSREQCEWLRERIEIPTPYKYSIEQKKQIFDRLTWATSFESFLSTKFPNDKRFGLEGLEAVVPGIKTLIDRSVELGVEDVVLGMAHRGRLNVLSNVVRKPNESIFSEFQGSVIYEDFEGSGDVKYHLGMNYQRPTVSGKYVNLSLVANPSHLEAQDPVVLGRVRAIQHSKGDVGTFDKAMGVLLHGDAAFAAQGVVYETMGFQHLPAYSTGGTIHVITNNQIGFTTDPRSARSTPYPSDIAKAIDAPIFHVNANDIEAVNFIFNLAADWRATFHTDAIIDVVGWRKHGHNETDQPSFTQPVMYKRIAKQKSVAEVYTDKLIKEGSMTNTDIESHKKWIWAQFEEAFAKAKDYKPTSREWLTAAWENFKSPKELATEILPHHPTNVDEATLKNIGKSISSWPKGFEVHRNLKRILSNRGKTVDAAEGIDWSTGEALAFGSMLLEGYDIRVSGEDVERGTFSQRHAVLHDQNSENTYTPLQHLSSTQADFTICNSSLSEYGCMGFEYGYSLTSPDYFVMWEAQFGDFANTAQVIIDQFIAGAETKWKQRSGLVLSLPHGYDGQGPEHSSGRLERFLQMANDDPRQFPSEAKSQREHQDCNFQVAYPTTPANLFHILRRQQHRQFRKPLALFFSKQLLRHPLARSNLCEFTEEGFKWIIEDPEHGKAIASKEETTRLVLLTGQVYTALHKRRELLDNRNTAFLRIEQLHPFPYTQLRDTFNSYPNLKDIVWCQEEPFNMGSWAYVFPRLQTTLKETEKYAGFEFRYAGRNPSGAVAAGSKALHTAEEEAFLKDVFEQ